MSQDAMLWRPEMLSTSPHSSVYVNSDITAIWSIDSQTDITEKYTRQIINNKNISWFTWK